MNGNASRNAHGDDVPTWTEVEAALDGGAMEEGEHDGESTGPRQRLECRGEGEEVVEGKTADGMTPGWG